MNDKKECRFDELTGAWDVLLPFKIDRIVDGMDGLKIYISGPRDDSKSGVFAFDGYYGYRNFNESNIWIHLENIGVTRSGVFVADRSEFLDWAAKQSISENVPSGVRHYIIASIEEILEVLAFDKPSFKSSNSGDKILEFR